LKSISKYNDKLIKPITKDVLSFLGMSDYKITADNVGDVFNNIFNNFEFKVANEISEQVSNILKSDKTTANI
jgi:hypothetical protein